MGYDIFSMREDREKAIAYDQKWGNTFWFNKETGEYERKSNTVYYRTNIGGMAVLRDIHLALGVADLNDSLYDNSGTVIRDWECEKFADAIDAKTDEEIAAAARPAIVAAYYAQADDLEEEVAYWVKEVRAWADFLRVCADLKGAEVC
jgi:hypothetical protein